MADRAVLQIARSDLFGLCSASFFAGIFLVIGAYYFIRGETILAAADAVAVVLFVSTCIILLRRTLRKIP
jgi:hypothetical protein